jgi:hypothetical protein
MICPNEPLYGLHKHPILLIPRKVAFICEICHEPGIGQPGQIVHSGECRTERGRQRARRAAGKHRKAAKA